jgi:hypothetical protein
MKKLLYNISLFLLIAFLSNSCVVCTYPEHEDNILGTWRISQIEHHALTEDLSKLTSGNFTFGSSHYEIKNRAGTSVEQGEYIYEAAKQNGQFTAYQTSIITNNVSYSLKLIKESSNLITLQNKDGSIKLFLIRQQ